MNIQRKTSSPLTGKRVLVTGASGFIGSHLVERLVKDQVIVAAVARTKGKLQYLDSQESYFFFPCDLLHARKIEEVVRRFAPEIVFHFAASPDGAESAAHTLGCMNNNVVATLNLLEAVRQGGGELFVYGDSVKVYGDSCVPYREAMPMRPISSYAISKAAGWELCNLYRRVHGVPTVSVRPTMMHGPRQSYNLVNFVVDCVMQKRPELVLLGGAQTRDLLFIEDAIEAFLLVSEAGAKLSGRVINIGGGEEQSVADLARRILDIMGSDLPIVVSPESMRPTDMRRCFCDNAEATEILGWSPRLPLSKALKLTVADLLAPRAKVTIIASARGAH
ncbi:MAG: SDR family NAD(P)-dependent oxidoreductase [Candidatus Acidiferrum sp.]